MNEELEIIPLVLLSGLVLYFGYEVNRRRTKLRRIFNTFDKEESKIAQVFEALVESGQLKAHIPDAVS